MTSNGTIRIAIQRSGRLADGSKDLLKAMGLQFEFSKDGLFATCRNLPIDILFLRDDDIPEYVQDGIADLGIVGANILRERPMNIEEVLPLDFGYCKMCIACSEQKSYSKVEDLQNSRIATSYPNTLARFLRSRSVEATIVTLKGCVEIAPTLNVADAICDLVSTGSTLRMNRLKIVDVLEESQAMLIQSSQQTEEKQILTKRLLMRARGVQEARRYKYIMFNLPKDRVSAVQALVPGAKSPTVVPLADPAFVAVHSVVLEEQFWETVEAIKECGGSGILVTAIEKFIR